MSYELAPHERFHCEDGKITYRITYLELQRRKIKPLPHPDGHIALMRLEDPTLDFYKYLYKSVGLPWLWWERLTEDEDKLLSKIRAETTEIRVLYKGGVPAGFAELDRTDPEKVELAYFGLLPDFIGQGLGPWFLEATIEAAFAQGDCHSLTLNTCTLDHPKALNAYQKAGFMPTGQKLRTISDPRLEGHIPDNSAKHIPLSNGSAANMDQLQT